MTLNFSFRQSEDIRWSPFYSSSRHTLNCDATSSFLYINKNRDTYFIMTTRSAYSIHIFRYRPFTLYPIRICLSFVAAVTYTTYILVLSNCYFYVRPSAGSRHDRCRCRVCMFSELNFCLYFNRDPSVQLGLCYWQHARARAPQSIHLLDIDELDQIGNNWREIIICPSICLPLTDRNKSL